MPDITVYMGKVPFVKSVVLQVSTDTNKIKTHMYFVLIKPRVVVTSFQVLILRKRWMHFHGVLYYLNMLCARTVLSVVLLRVTLLQDLFTGVCVIFYSSIFPGNITGYTWYGITLKT
jgi:hypothetical protein